VEAPVLFGLVEGFAELAVGVGAGVPVQARAEDLFDVVVVQVAGLAEDLVARVSSVVIGLLPNFFAVSVIWMRASIPSIPWPVSARATSSA
jgi:hypothetical protein